MALVIFHDTYRNAARHAVKGDNATAQYVLGLAGTVQVSEPFDYKDAEVPAFVEFYSPLLALPETCGPVPCERCDSYSL